MTSARTGIQPRDPDARHNKAFARWLERMARRFYRSSDDVTDLVSLTIERIGPERGDLGCDERYKHLALSIMGRIVMERCKTRSAPG